MTNVDSSVCPVERYLSELFHEVPPQQKCRFATVKDMNALRNRGSILVVAEAVYSMGGRNNL